MLTILAEVASDNSMNWTVVIALGTLASLAVSLVTLARFATGKSGERQIEPTQIAAIQVELRAQTNTLNDINREMGEAKAGIAAVDGKVTAQGAEVANAFRRINAISAESAANTARIEGLEKRERHHRA